MNALEYRNETEHAKLKPTKENPKEVPFIKNNPREKDLNPSAPNGANLFAALANSICNNGISSGLGSSLNGNSANST